MILGSTKKNKKLDQLSMKMSYHFKMHKIKACKIQECQNESMPAQFKITKMVLLNLILLASLMREKSLPPNGRGGGGSNPLSAYERSALFPKLRKISPSRLKMNLKAETNFGSIVPPPLPPDLDLSSEMFGRLLKTPLSV